MTTRVHFGWPQMILLGAVGGVLAVGALLYTRSTAATNKVAMADTAKPVSVTTAAAQPFQTTRRYVGTAEPWLEARIGHSWSARWSTPCWSGRARSPSAATCSRPSTAATRRRSTSRSPPRRARSTR